jgi:hypothetical protein
MIPNADTVTINMGVIGNLLRVVHSWLYRINGVNERHFPWHSQVDYW